MCVCVLINNVLKWYFYANLKITLFTGDLKNISFYVNKALKEVFIINKILLRLTSDI